MGFVLSIYFANVAIVYALELYCLVSDRRENNRKPTGKEILFMIVAPFFWILISLVLICVGIEELIKKLKPLFVNILNKDLF
jgi:hypothetical protein